MTVVFDPHQPARPPTASRTRALPLARGLTVLAVERLRTDPRPLALTVGVATTIVSGGRRLTVRVLAPAGRAARRTGRPLTHLPLIGRLTQLGSDRLITFLAEARARGDATVAADRAAALRAIRGTVDEALAWAQERVVPQLIDGALPQIRARVLPVIVDDLTNDPHVRDLVVEQSRGVLGGATQQLQTTTAHADDRVESGLRRLLRRAAPVPPDTPVPPNTRVPSSTRVPPNTTVPSGTRVPPNTTVPPDAAQPITDG